MKSLINNRAERGVLGYGWPLRPGPRCGTGPWVKGNLKYIVYSSVFTAKYKTQSKLPTPWHFWHIKISDLVIISNPMGEMLKFLLVTPNFFADPMGKSFKIKLATLNI